MRVVLTGASGMLGSSIRDAWGTRGAGDELVPLTRADVDLRDPIAVRRAVGEIRPDVVLHAAAAVGGIAAKLEHPTRYLLDNSAMDAAVLSAALAADVRTYVYIGSAAAYPASATQPLRPESLGTGRLEDANEPYGLAKLTGIRLCEYVVREYGYDYRAILPCNLYGPADHFDVAGGHLVAAALRKAHEAVREGADELVVWGDGESRRELLFAPDLASWLVGSLEDIRRWPTVMNVGLGGDEAIDRFYELASEIVGFTGRLVHDVSKPNGIRRRLMDSGPASEFGWAPSTSLEDGMRQCYAALSSTVSES